MEILVQLAGDVFINPHSARFRFAARKGTRLFLKQAGSSESRCPQRRQSRPIARSVGCVSGAGGPPLRTEIPWGWDVRQKDEAVWESVCSGCFDAAQPAWPQISSDCGRKRLFNQITDMHRGSRRLTGCARCSGRQVFLGRGLGLV